MDRTNVIGLGLLLAFVGFMAGRLDAKSRAAPAAVPAAAVAAAPAAAPAAAAPTPAPKPAAAAPTPAPKPAAAAPVAKAAPTGLASQTDEGAGKGADLGKIGHSPKQGSAYLGDDSPLVRVNVFSDFQCPVCRRSADPIKQLVLDYPDDVQVVFRHNALAMHQRAKPAAIAAVAAQRQGKFWEYHDKLFETRALDDASLLRHAQELGLDMAKFQQDLTNPEIAKRVETESSWAEQLGARGTPAFFVNGVRQVGWGSYLALKSMVGRELKEARDLVAAGTKADQVLAARIKDAAGSNHLREGESSPSGSTWASVLTQP